MSIVFEAVHFGYNGSTPVLRGVDCEIGEGEFVLITGRNGAGKSTMLKLFNGLIRPESGRVLVNGLDTRTTTTARLAAQVAVTFQHPSDQIFSATVLGEVRYGPRNLGRPDPDSYARRALELFGLAPFLAMHPYDLHPAHRRLLTMASAAAMGSSFLAFDEPSVHLSQPERKIVLKAVEELRSDKRTMIVVSHDERFFGPLSTMILRVEDGVVRRV